jgi:hypothetical protein
MLKGQFLRGGGGDGEAGRQPRQEGSKVGVAENRAPPNHSGARPGLETQSPVSTPGQLDPFVRHPVSPS